MVFLQGPSLERFSNPKTGNVAHLPNLSSQYYRSLSGWSLLRNLGQFKYSISLNYDNCLWYYFLRFCFLLLTCVIIVNQLSKQEDQQCKSTPDIGTKPGLKPLQIVRGKTLWTLSYRIFIDEFQDPKVDSIMQHQNDNTSKMYPNKLLPSAILNSTVGLQRVWQSANKV